jgi:alpha/beta superfamily hydrolase
MKDLLLKSPQSSERYEQIDTSIEYDTTYFFIQRHKQLRTQIHNSLEKNTSI